MNRPWHFLIIGVFVLLLDFIFHFTLLTKIMMAHVDNMVFLLFMHIFNKYNHMSTLGPALRNQSIHLSICPSVHSMMSLLLYFLSTWNIWLSHRVAMNFDFEPNIQIRVQGHSRSQYTIFVLNMFSYPLAKSGPKRSKQISCMLFAVTLNLDSMLKVLTKGQSLLSLSSHQCS